MKPNENLLNPYHYYQYNSECPPVAGFPGCWLFFFSSEQVPNHPASHQPKSASSCNPAAGKLQPEPDTGRSERMITREIPRSGIPVWVLTAVFGLSGIRYAVMVTSRTLSSRASLSTGSTSPNRSHGYSRGCWWPLGRTGNTTQSHPCYPAR